MKKRFSDYLRQKNNKIILNIGEVNLISKIGEGGNGLVYEGKVLDNSFAFKFLVTEASGSSKERKEKRFLSEYFNIASITDSRGLVKYIDYDNFILKDEIGDVTIPVIIMKKYNNSLSKLEENEKSEEIFENIFEFLLDTVEKIHSSGIIHRDIKPENILQDNDGLVLADFGIASYNPEIFSLIAITQKGERIGNRLFSAPEQEEGGVEAKETMDIYAIGQVLHWMVYGETHRGTNRTKIGDKYQSLKKYDSIIEKCLSNNQEARYQTIQEIRDDLDLNNINPRKNVWHYLFEFGEILVRNYPKNEFGIIHSDNLKRIDRLFNDIKENANAFFADQENLLWWHNGSSNIHFTLTQKGEGIWKLNNKEITIKEIWIHYDESFFNDFIVVHYNKGEPFIVDGKETYYTGIVDDKYYISDSEYENKYAEIGDEVINLREHKVEFIERKREEGYLIIATRYHCALRTENDAVVRGFFAKLLENRETVSLEDFQAFQYEIRENKLDEIRKDL